MAIAIIMAIVARAVYIMIVDVMLLSFSGCAVGAVVARTDFTDIAVSA